MSTDHPLAIAAAAKAAERRKEREDIKALVKQAVARGYKFLHAGTHTICYRCDGHNVVELSTAIRNPCDKVSPLHGKGLALARYTRGERIMVRTRGKSPREYLMYMFAFANAQTRFSRSPRR